jgi:hypothetical protein
MRAGWHGLEIDQEIEVAAVWVEGPVGGGAEELERPDVMNAAEFGQSFSAVLEQLRHGLPPRSL